MADKADCPLCSTPTKVVLTRVLRRGTGIVFHCENCDLGFLVAEPVDPKEHYAGAYREKASHRVTGGPTNPQELFDVYSRYQAGRLTAVLPHVRGDSSVLEIGASAGQFLAHLDGLCARRCAIELDPACCEFMRLRGIEAEYDMVSASRFANEKFDVVCAFQTLEHVPDPIGFLKDIRSVLAPSGTAFVEVPNLHEPLLSVWNIPEYVPFYYHSDHLFYFSVASLKWAAREAGFANPRVRFTQDYNLLSHLHWLMNKGPQPTCEIGLGPVAFEGHNEDIARWLSNELDTLNSKYIERLKSAGATSNLLMILN